MLPLTIDPILLARPEAALLNFAVFEKLLTEQRGIFFPICSVAALAQRPFVALLSSELVLLRRPVFPPKKGVGNMAFWLKPPRFIASSARRAN